jgi:hypothetical protein
MAIDSIFRTAGRRMGKVAPRGPIRTPIASAAERPITSLNSALSSMTDSKVMNPKLVERIGGVKRPATGIPSRRSPVTEWSESKRFGKQVKNNKAGIRQYVDAGMDAPKGTAFESMKEVAGGMWNQIKNTGIADADYLGSAIGGAAVGGAVSGTNEWANGGSFWGGFKGGMAAGALGGAAIKGARVGAYGQNYAKRSTGDAVGNISKNFNNRQASKTSSALKTLRLNAENNKLVQDNLLKNKKR